MREGLQTLKELYSKLSCKSSIKEIKENLYKYDIIKNELIKYYQLREELNKALNLNECQTVKEWVELMQKKLAALEIIKKNITNINENSYYGVLSIFVNIKLLTKDEYSLLMEVLK